MLKIHRLKLKNMLANFKKSILESTFYKKLTEVLSCFIKYFHQKMFWGIFRRFDEKFIKYLFVGALNTLFSYALYAILVTIGLKANPALFFQYIIGVLWNFKTTGSLVFKNHDNKLIFKFIACYIFTFILNSLLLKLLIIYLNPYISQALLVFPIAVVSFIIMKLWVFKAK